MFLYAWSLIDAFRLFILLLREDVLVVKNVVKFVLGVTYD